MGVTSGCTTSDQRAIVRATEEFVRDRLGHEPTGHDWWHAVRVRRTALWIAEREAADLFVVELTALLHDVADYKFSGSDDAGPAAAADWLESVGVGSATAVAVATIIRTMSFRGAQVPDTPLTLEGRCVQDADRLDGIGAIGIARTFAYGGYVKRPIHDPSVPSVPHETAEAYRAHLGTTYNHFHEKLLLLHERMTTDAGRRLARQRHEFMLRFLAEFESEWDGLSLENPAAAARGSATAARVPPGG